jgi:hypothetical protein
MTNPHVKTQEQAEPGTSAPTVRNVFPAVLAPSDSTLLARMAAGDKRAMEPFYARWETAVRGALFLNVFDTSTTDDVVEDVFWHAWCAAASFDPAKSSVEKWLLGIARAVCLERCRTVVGGDDRYGAW